MHTVRSSPYRGEGSHWQRPLWTENPWTEDPLPTETPLDRDQAQAEVNYPSGQRPPPPSTDLEGTWDQSVKQELTAYRDALHCTVNGMTHESKNMTLS